MPPTLFNVRSTRGLAGVAREWLGTRVVAIGRINVGRWQGLPTWGALVLVVVPVAARAQPNLVSNGGFEQPGFGGANYRYLTGGDAGLITGWTLSYDGAQEASYVFHSSRYETTQGIYTIYLNDGDALTSSVSVRQGITYRFSFDQCIVPGATFPDQLEISCAGAIVVVTAADGVPIPGVGSRGSPLQRFSKLLVSTVTGPAVLRIANPQNRTGCFACGGVSLDNVMLVEVCDTIAQQPPSRSVCGGSTATFGIVLEPNNGSSFQWRRNGRPIDASFNSSAATATLTLSNVGPRDVGSYDCVVTNVCGSATSNTAALTLQACGGCSLADVAGGGPDGRSFDGVVDGSDFVAFINSFAIGDVAIDPLADVAGGGTGATPDPDGTIDGTDFVAFINAFALGC